MKSLTSKFASSRGWALFLILFLGAGLFVAACGDEDVPTPTTPAPTPPAPPPTPAPEPEPEPMPEPPAVPVGLSISASGVDFIEWSWSAVEGVSGYDVQYSANEAFTDEDEEIARTAEQISYRRENLEAETNHYLRVRSAAGTGDGRVTSSWSTHVTGMTPAATPPPPVAPAAPANLKVSDTGEDFIEWTWDRVVGAAGYIAQFSTDSRFAAGDPEFTVEGVANTKHKVSNLDATSNGYLRVRAYAGTAADPTLGEWTEGARGTTAEPTAPVTTALSAPTGLRTGSSTTTTITLDWDAVDDADSYDVDQRPADGSWTGASCNGGDSQVNSEECEASGLTRGTDYSFRVRANPDPDDDTLEQSAWSSSASAQTSGTTPSTPITGGDAYEITWESGKDTETSPHSITWTWSRPDDGRIRFLIALVSPAEDMRPACPPLTVTSDATEFEDPDLGDTTGWFGAGTGGTDDGLAQYSREVVLTVTAAGDVRRLCVVPTWKDPNSGTRKYGDIFSAWAATPPKKPALESDGRLSDSGTNTIAEGHKDDSTTARTTAIDWFVEKDQGFTYEVRTVSASVDDVPPTCKDDRSGSTNFTSTQDNQAERFRLPSPTAYTAYKACVRAVNDQGMSGWTDLAEYKTLPSAPSSLGAASQANIVTGATAVSGKLVWSFGESNTTPEAPGGYTVNIYHNFDTAPTVGATLTALDSTCDMVGTGQSGSAMVSETGSGFGFEWDLPSASRQVFSGGVNYTITVLACVQAELTRTTGIGAGTASPGPWRSAKTSVTVRKLTQ